jgi:mRNA interferase MazF
MTILFHPNPGTILICDFTGFEKPEMVKTRPVLVVSPRMRHGAQLCTIVPLSTTLPNPILAWHYKLLFKEPLSPKWPELEMWVKGNMLYTFGYDRLDRFHRRVGDKRKYYDVKVSEDIFNDIRHCIRSFLDC